MLLSLNDGTEVGPVPVGQPVYAVTTIVNGGATAADGSPRSARRAVRSPSRFSCPRPGTMLRPGQSVTVQFGYTSQQGRYSSVGRA